jgi:uncharacterized protein (TIGR03437 family)
MRLMTVALAFAVFATQGLCEPATTSNAPTYSALSIVQAATQTPEALAPNTIATIYGTNLAIDTETVSSSNLLGGTLPESLGGVNVIVGGYYATLFFISPNQVNFLVPYNLTAGTVPVVLTSQGIAGPPVSIQLNSTAPGMFVYNGFAIATHLDGMLVAPAAPANPGEIIVIYVAGLGRVTPDTTPGKIVTAAASISAESQMQVLLAGTPCPAANVLYAGLAPGFAGLYQVNLVVPPLTPPNPEIRISVGPSISPPEVLLAVQ